MNYETVLKEHKILVSKGEDFYSLLAEEYTNLYIIKNREKVIREIKLLKERAGGGHAYSAGQQPQEIPQQQGQEKSLFSKFKDKVRNAFRTVVRGIEKNVPVTSATGRRQLSSEYEKFVQQNKQVMDKLSKQVLTANLFSKIDRIAPSFPNNDKGPSNTEGLKEFKEVIAAIAATYLSIKAAVNAGNMPVAIANELIADLRSYVKHNLDNQLSDYYKHALQEQVDYASESETLKGLKSLKAPVVLAGLGALGIGFEWLTKQSWFIDLLREPAQIKNFITNMTGLEQKGVTEHFATLLGRPGANISGMKISDFVSGMKSHGLVDASGNPTTNLLNLAKDGGNTNFANWWATNIAGADPNSTLEKAIPLSGSGAPNAGGQIFTKKIVRGLASRVVKGALTTGATTILNLGPLAGILGIGLVGAGAAIAALRYDSLKNSRAAYLGQLLNIMQDLPETPKTITATAGSGTTTQQQEPQQPQEPKQVDFYVKKSGEGNDQKSKSLSDLLNASLSKNWKGSQRELDTLINTIVAGGIGYSLELQGAKIQEARFTYDPKTRTTTKREKNQIDKLMSYTEIIRNISSQLRNREYKGNVRDFIEKIFLDPRIKEIFSLNESNRRNEKQSLLNRIGNVLEDLFGFDNNKKLHDMTSKLHDLFTTYKADLYNEREQEGRGGVAVDDPKNDEKESEESSEESVDSLLNMLVQIANSDSSFEEKLAFWTSTYKKALGIYFKDQSDKQTIVEKQIDLINDKKNQILKNDKYVFQVKDEKGNVKVDNNGQRLEGPFYTFITRMGDSIENSRTKLSIIKIFNDERKVQNGTGSGTGTETSQSGNGNRTVDQDRLDKLLNELVRISESKTSFDTKIDNWVTTFELACAVFGKDGKEFLEYMKEILDYLITYNGDLEKDYIEKAPQGIGATGMFFGKLTKLGDKQDPNFISPRTRKSLYKILFDEFLKGKGKTTTGTTTSGTGTGNRTAGTTSNTGTGVVKGGNKSVNYKQKYVARYSRVKDQITKFLKSDLRTYKFNDNEVEDIEDQIFSTVENWINNQRADKGTEKDKSGQTYLGLAESQIIRWKQLAGILKD